MQSIAHSFGPKIEMRCSNERSIKMELEWLVDCAGTADWRRRVAERFPGDDRNAEAANTLDRLAGDLVGFKRGSLHTQLAALWEHREDFGEVVSEELRRVGFYSWPATGSELLEGIVARFTA
jgi:hypothetical protein